MFTAALRIIIKKKKYDRIINASIKINKKLQKGNSFYTTAFFRLNVMLFKNR